jgi:hypothetical protein
MGDARAQAAGLIEAVDTTMRNAYDIHIARVGLNIFPILYVDFTLYGGRYTLVENASRMHVRQPNLAGYTELKSIAHTPLGIFLMIGEYWKYPGNGQWKAPLLAYRDQLALSLRHVTTADSALTSNEVAVAQGLIDKSLIFINDTIANGTFTLDGYRTYTMSVAQEVQFCTMHAGARQVAGMSDVVLEYKQMLGDRWDDVYVAIAAIWTLTRENIHELIIKKHMREDRQETHVVVSEAIPTLADARTLLGRIVGDRVIGEHVFNRDGTLMEREDLYSISSSRDLLSQVAKQALGDPAGAARASEAAFARLCPHLARKTAA